MATTALLLWLAEWVRVIALLAIIGLNAALFYLDRRRAEQKSERKSQDEQFTATKQEKTDSSGLRTRRSQALGSVSSDTQQPEAITEDLRALLVIAHPDDESMFFGPTLTLLQRQDFETHILCLSTGDYEKKGAIRSKELIAAAAQYHIPPQQVHIIDDSRLQDGPTQKWEEPVIAKYVSECVRDNNIQKVITFDCAGASWHPNHIDTHYGVRRAAMQHAELDVYYLESVSLIRKYLGIVDFLFSFWKSRLALVMLLDFLVIQKAMAAHASQYVFYRRLSMVFSRYAYMNSLYEEVEHRRPRERRG